MNVVNYREALFLKEMRGKEFCLFIFFLVSLLPLAFSLYFFLPLDCIQGQSE